MNHIIYNLALIILFAGIIMMTVYITRASLFNFMTTDKLSLVRASQQRINPSKTIYDYYISKEYEKMFSQPSIWLGYQDFDPNYEPTKLLIK